MKHICTLIILTALMFAAGCGVETREPLEKQTYLLDIEKSAETPATSLCVKVLPCRVASPYSDRSLVYRIGTVEYEQAYYNHFITSPNVQITEAMQRWFQRTEPASGTPIVTLQPEVDVLCADFRNAENPVAVIEMNVTLKHGDKVKNQSFKAQTPLPAKPTTVQIVEALSQSLTDILTELTDYLNKTNVEK